MRSSRAATVTSLEPWPSARSNGPLRRAQRTSAPERWARPRALAATRPPRWRPMTSCSMPKRSHSCTVWAKSRAVTRTCAPRSRSTSMTGRMTSTCGLLVRSTQIRIAHGRHDLVDLAAAHGRGHRQGQVRARQLVGRGQLDVPEGGHRRLAVDGGAVVGARPDAGRAERGDQVVGALVADHVDVPRGARALGDGLQRDELAETRLRVPLAGAVAVGGPALQLGQLDAQDGGLKLVEARVVAHLVAVDLGAR